MMINIEINIIRVSIKKKAEIKEVKVEVREEEIKEKIEIIILQQIIIQEH